MKKFIIFLFISAFFLSSCKGVDMTEKASPKLPSLNDIGDEQLKKLANVKIYFGHQSVGYNIIDGLKDLMEQNNQLNLNIVETDNPEVLSKPGFIHSKVGQNSNPNSKADEFKDLMEKGFDNKTDIAFFKFCYVDIKFDSNPQEIFRYYQDTLSALEENYPDTTFVHVTMPLTAAPAGIKATIKRIIKSFLGKPIYGYDDNIKRHEFNELMRRTYANRAPLFDLALIESIQPNGKQIEYTRNGKPFYQLYPDYTDDGGHLNKEGRKRIAEQLILFLAGLI